MAELLGSIDKSYEEYEDKIKFTIRSLEVSSSELNQSNRQLEQLNTTINTILDSLGQGLLFFDKDGICSPVYSEACQSLLEVSPGNMLVADILKLDGQTREDFMLWLSVVFEEAGALPFNDLKSLAPQQFTNSKNQFIELDYRPLYFNQVMSGILLIATDKTMERDAAARIETTRNEAKKIESIARRRNDYWRFLYNFSAFLDQIATTETSGAIRGMHTYKGLAQLFGLSELSLLLHQAEGKLTTEGLTPDLGQALLGELEQARQIGTDLFGPDFVDGGQVRVFEYALLQDFRDMIEKSASTDTLLDFFKTRILAVPLFSGFDIFKSEIIRIAESQGKAIPQIVFNNCDYPIILKDYELFFDALVHLARNIVDHGLENPSQRRAKGKTEAGVIMIEASLIERDGKRFYHLDIQDDGRGFDITQLKMRLEERQAGSSSSMTEAQIIDCIFDPSFSTAAAVTSLSGRGVGMNALRIATEELGGQVSALPATSGGARFLIDLPCSL